MNGRADGLQKSRHILYTKGCPIPLESDYPFADLHQQVMVAAGKAGFEVHDLLPVFEGKGSQELWVHPSDQHPNEVGQAIAARSAAEPIAQRLPGCPAPVD